MKDVHDRHKAYEKSTRGGGFIISSIAKACTSYPTINTAEELQAIQTMQTHNDFMQQLHRLKRQSDRKVESLARKYCCGSVITYWDKLLHAYNRWEERIPLECDRRILYDMVEARKAGIFNNPLVSAATAAAALYFSRGD